VPVGWREEHSLGAAEVQAVAGAVADLTREPSRRPSSGNCGQANHPARSAGKRTGRRPLSNPPLRQRGTVRLPPLPE
jgi:hypothetical protein